MKEYKTNKELIDYLSSKGVVIAWKYRLKFSWGYAFG